MSASANPIPSPAPEPPRSREGYVTCGNCECKLTATGDVYRMSDPAKKMLKASENLTELQSKYDSLKAEFEQYKKTHTIESRPVEEPTSAAKKRFSLF